jgi:ABC-type nitrate/sulfonate/bicarbonate transport system substrate-binding protein
VRRAGPLAAALCAATVLLGCGQKREATTLPPAHPFAIALAGGASGLYGGLYTALANGDFARGGLAVSVKATATGQAALDALSAGTAEVAIASEPELLGARDSGRQLIAIGALVQQPLEAIISVHPRIAAISQLGGQTVTTGGTPLQTAELDTVLRNAGVDPATVRQINGGANPTRSLLARRAAAAFGGYWNYDAVALELRHLNPSVITLPGKGVPSYSQQVLVVRLAEAHNDGPLLRAFLQSLTRGEEAARAAPTQATSAVLAADPRLDRRFEGAVIRRTLTAAFPSDPRQPFGYQDPRAWQAFGQWMLANRLVSRPPTALDAITDEFLPGQGD